MCEIIQYFKKTVIILFMNVAQEEAQLIKVRLMNSTPV
jgi:hypothetical protein